MKATRYTRRIASNLSNKHFLMTQSSTSELDDYFSHVPMADDVNKDDLNTIREWIQTQPHLPFVSDRQISILLHSCYGAIELTKTTIENYYTKRTEMTDIFSDRNVDEVKAYLRVVWALRSSVLSVDNYHIFYLGFLDKDVAKFDCRMNGQLLFALLDIHTNLRPYAPGWRLCINANGLSFGHFMKLTAALGLARRLVSYLQTALPIRLKGIHIINANPLVSQFVNLLKPFMKKELVDLIHIHSVSDDTIFEYLPKESIPQQDYNNLAASGEELIAESLALLDEYEGWFEADKRVARVDESKRIPVAKQQKGPSFLMSLWGARG